MKICPQCRTTYADDMQFCLQDGTPLAQQTASQSWSEPPETLISPSGRERIRVDVPGQQQPPNWTAETSTIVQTEKESKTGLVVALTILGTLLVAGAGVIGVMLYNRGKDREVVANNNKNINVVIPINSNQKASPSPTASASVSPTATPTPKPTLDPKESDRIKSNVKDVIENWKDASENLDLDGNLSNYADTVDYYNAGKVSADRVRADKQRAFGAYDSIDIGIDNVKITPDASGEKATVIFDKEWKFENAEKFSTGKVQQQLILSRINGRWLITGEKDLKVYKKSVE